MIEAIGIGIIRDRLRQMEEHYITVRGITTRYVVMGAGSPVLLAHGFGEFLEIWSFNLEPLSQHCLVYAFDFPGHGLSEKPRVDYTAAFTTEFIIDFMQTLGIEHASLVGHSAGGLACLNVAINFPEKVDKLVLVDSGGLGDEVPILYRLATLPVLGEVIIKPTIKAGISRGIKRAFYNPDIVKEDWIDLNCQYLQMHGAKEAMLSIIRNSASLSGPRPGLVMTDKLHLVKSPTLIIHGADDPVVPVGNAQNATNLIPNSKLEVFANCGHCPHIEKAAEFNEAVISFLGQRD